MKRSTIMWAKHALVFGTWWFIFAAASRSWWIGLIMATGIFALQVYYERLINKVHVEETPAPPTDKERS